MASLLSGAKRHSRCFFGVALGSTSRQYSINSLGTLGISTSFHANMSRLALRKLMSALSYLSPKPSPIKAVLDGSSSLQLDGLDADVAGVGFNPRLARPLVGDLHLCVGQLQRGRGTSADGSSMREVVAYSIESWSQSYGLFRSPRSVSTPVLPEILSSR
jgi:hypothetical protein